MKTTQRFVLGCTAAFFFCLPYFSSLFDPWNRIELAWSSVSPWTLLVLIAVMGCAIAMGARMIERALPAGALRDQLMLLGLFLFVWPGFDSLRISTSLLGRAIEDALKLVAIGGIGYAILRCPAATKAKARALLFIFSPTVLLFFGKSFTFAPSPTVSGTLTRPLEAKGPPVFFFLFDEWSYDHAFQSQKPMSDLSALTEIAGESLVFHRAVAPGRSTNESVPRLLGEPRLDRGARPDSVYVVSNSVFEKAHAAGWTARAVGCYLPYALWFADDTAYSRQLPAYKMPDPSFLDRLVCHANLAVFAALTRWNAAAAERAYHPFAARVQRARIDAMTELTERVLAASAGGTFDYFHFSLPHDPFLDGTYDGNVRAVDATLKTIKQALVDGKMWDRSLVIITSDHGWRKDLQLDRAATQDQRDATLRHVPLLVKLPHAAGRGNIDAPFQTGELKKFLAAVFASREDRIRFAEGRFIVGR